MMDTELHKLRLERSQEHALHCLRVSFSDDTVIFCIDGLTDVYTVEINQDAHMWEVGVSPTCTCEDHLWRNCVCKHIVFALHLMGATDDFLLDCLWDAPDQNELYEWLCNAPSCVGSSATMRAGDKEKQYR